MAFNIQALFSSYQSLCNDDSPHPRHEVQRHRWLQPGQHPPVENVFHTIPHPSKNGSGVPPQLQHQRLESEGRQLQSGQRIPPSASSWSGPDMLTVIWSDAQSSFKNRRSGTDGALVTFILEASIRPNIDESSSCCELAKVASDA